MFSTLFPHSLPPSVVACGEDKGGSGSSSATDAATSDVTTDGGASVDASSADSTATDTAAADTTSSDAGPADGGPTDGGSTPPDSIAGTCDRVLEPSDDGLCTVTPGDDRLLIEGDLVLLDGLLEAGQLLVEGDMITCVGCDCEDAAQGATRLTCAQGVISPGLVNAHDHITFTEMAPVPHGDERYDHRHEWRKGKNGKTKLGSKQNKILSLSQLRLLSQLLHCDRKVMILQFRARRMLTSDMTRASPKLLHYMKRVILT